MLKVTIPSIELYDEEKNIFFPSKEQLLILEHSLVSLSKWESKWCKPFLAKDKKTIEESTDYVRCMTTNQNVDPYVYNLISDDTMAEIGKYIEAPMTATITSKQNGPKNREIITAEIIYYWMIAHNIPFECQKWHLNRLITLIEVCNIKNQSPKKMSRRETMQRNASLNAARRQAMNTRG